MSEIDLDLLQQWVGRKEQAKDVIARNPAAALAATLNWETLPSLGDPLPPLWHWAYFTPLATQAELGADGHPRLGGFMPPIPLPRRMWAGGRVRFEAPILIGEAVTRETEILSITQKVGKQGPLIFVALRHRLSTERGLAIEEEQDLVYRAPSNERVSAASEPVAPPPALWRDAMQADPTLLFRYSALTFNAHRIHYDAAYAVEEEGYPALVVQGPLTATLLANNLTQHTGAALAEFNFRGQQPLFVNTPFNLCASAGDGEGAYNLWAETTGGATMSAAARLRPQP